MKNLLFLICLSFISDIVCQSCDGDIGCRNQRNQYPSGTFSSPGSSWSVVSYAMNAGNYTLFNVTSGNTYQWSYCTDFGGSQPWNAELTLLNNSNGQFLCYQNNSNRTNCPNAPYLSWTATFTGTVKLLTTQASCMQNTGSPYGTLVWKEIVNSGGGGNCVSFYNGVTSDAEFITAANRLCNYGVISNSFNVSYMFDWIKKKDLALLIYRSLYGSNDNQILNYPHPFADLDILSSDEKRAMLTMLYLEFPKNGESDGIAPLSRDFFNVEPIQAISNERAIRVFFESFNITPDWTGYDKNNSNTIGYYNDVRYNNPYLGYIRSGYFNNFYANNSCGSGNFCPNDLLTVRNAYIMLDKFITAFINLNISANGSQNYFNPNTLTSSSLGNQVGIDRGVFSHYEDQSFSIKGGGLPLEFEHAYYSHYTELPRFDDIREQNKTDIQRYHPLGKAWTHNYNIYVQEIESTYLNNRKFYFYWADGTIDIYNYTTSKWETDNGKYNQIQFTMSSGGGVYVDKIVVTNRNHIQYTFDHVRPNEYFNLTEIKDRNDNKQTLSYEQGVLLGGNYTPSRLKTVTDNVSNRSLSFAYLPSTNLIDYVADNSDRRVYFTYDFNTLDLKTFTDAQGGKYQYTYGQNDYDKNLLKSITKPKGNTIYADYYKRKLKQTHSNGYVVDVDFQTNYANTSETKSVITTTQNGQTSSSSITHSSKGLPLKIQDSSQYLEFVYAFSDNPTLPSAIYDRYKGLNHHFEYDSRGNTTVKTLRSANQVEIQTERYEYNSMWNVVNKYIDPKGNITNYAIDNVSGNLWFITYPDATKTTFARNTNGNITKITLPDDKVVTMSYNQYGNLSEYGYEGSPNRVKAGYNTISNINSITDAKGVSNNYSFNRNDKLIKKQDDVNGLNEVTEYIYDVNENLTNVIDAKGQGTTLMYNNLDELVQESSGGGAYTKTWSYNEDGTLKNFKNKGNVDFNYQYYVKGSRLEGKLQNDGYAFYGYDFDKKYQNQISKGSSLVYWNFDDLGRTSTVTSNDMPGNLVSYQYDANNNITRISYPSGFVVGYKYDSRNRMTEVNDVNSSRLLVAYQYYPDGRVKQETRLNGTETKYFYDAENRLDSIAHTKSSSEVIAAYKYELDANGNHTAEIAYEPFATGLTTTSPFATPQTFSFDNTNRVTGTNLGNVTHTGNGALSGFENLTLNFDSRDNLLGAVNSSSGNTINFAYDGLENRRSVNNTIEVRDILNNQNLLAEFDKTTNNPTAYYIHGLGLVCKYDVANAQFYFYHFDSRGSTVAMTNPAQETVNAYQYGTFGEQTAFKETVANPFQYVGKYGVQYHGTRLYFMRARYYNPYYGRFYSEDPVWSTNLYPYADNNPINRIDPEGEFSLDLIPIPIYSSLKDADKAFNNGKPFWGVVNLGLAVSDVFLAKAIAQGIVKSLGKTIVKSSANGAARASTKLLNPAINITDNGLAHTIDRHTINGVSKWASKSKFYNASEVETLIRQGTQLPLTRLANGNFSRTVNAGRKIGIDRTTGSPTSIYTIITDGKGNLVTAFPGSL